MARITRRQRARARALRRDDNPVETLLWARLRGRRLGGLRFRRQHPLGPYTLDFYCPGARLAVEVDGTEHMAEQREARDRSRDLWLEAQGVRTLRFTSTEVLGGLELVLEEILAVARAEEPEGRG